VHNVKVPDPSYTWESGKYQFDVEMKLVYIPDYWDVRPKDPKNPKAGTESFFLRREAWLNVMDCNIAMAERWVKSHFITQPMADAMIPCMKVGPYLGDPPPVWPKSAIIGYKDERSGGTPSEWARDVAYLRFLVSKIQHKLAQVVNKEEGHNLLSKFIPEVGIAAVHHPIKAKGAIKVMKVSAMILKHNNWKEMTRVIQSWRTGICANRRKLENLPAYMKRTHNARSWLLGDKLAQEMWVDYANYVEDVRTGKVPFSTRTKNAKAMAKTAAGKVSETITVGVKELFSKAKTFSSVVSETHEKALASGSYMRGLWLNARFQLAKAVSKVGQPVRDTVKGVVAGVTTIAMMVPLFKECEKASWKRILNPINVLTKWYTILFCEKDSDGDEDDPWNEDPLARKMWRTVLTAPFALVGGLFTVAAKATMTLWSSVKSLFN